MQGVSFLKYNQTFWFVSSVLASDLVLVNSIGISYHCNHMLCAFSRRSQLFCVCTLNGPCG